ncbi:tyrosine-type recombinase/integrase [Streptomyces sp. MBT42]|uniref:site-specific integrase n=1 Tax=Streptomyces sp. MBT42 TaxID=1488373 RepID=UPI001E4CF3F1|nr:tyrosine-type recombinase/integrase [Streptomyces sp. MBT42]MCD2461940.1 tyrosine-type recombinase/integrase [Streptomyces sp. MBT42]MCD2465520.1 tyrosine-type recombinase/integrase [Streptomyces sp. MBT42]
MPAARRSGSITRRCECRGPDGKLLGSSCPKLKRKNHGSYAIRQELPSAADSTTRRAFRRVGYSRVDDAQNDLSRLQAILDLAGDDAPDLARVGDFLADLSARRADIPEVAEVQRRLGVGVPLDGKSTVGEWLDRWAESKKTRANTTAGYASHIRVHLKPRIGHHRLDRLSVGHLREMFAAIADEADLVRAENEARREQVARSKWTRPGRPPAKERERLAAEREKLAEMKPFRKVTGLATRHAIRRTLRAALNSAIRDQLITFNPAAHVELDSYSRPKGLLWTEERVERWRTAGAVPSPVMVWTPEQLGRFLDAAEEHRLYSFFHTIAHHGLRRGEGVGASWADAHLDASPPRIEVLKEIVLHGRTPTETAPKTDSSTAAVMLDRETVDVLRERRRQQLAEREAWNKRAAELRARGEQAYDWLDTGKIWTASDGAWLHPDALSAEFQAIRERAGLPPINLRDLRHGAAALVKAGGGDIDDAKRKLRHSTIVLTSDTYMELFTEYEEGLVERSAAAVPRARRGRDQASEADVERPVA